jgi:pilus assembly protein CpaE
VIESAQHILVITALTIPAIKDAKLALKVLESLTVDPAAVLLVVDRSDAHSDFNKESIEQNLRQSVGAQIPYEPRVVGDSINRGTPFVTASPESEISRSIRELAGALVPGAQPVAAGVGGGKADDKRKRRIFGR